MKFEVLGLCYVATYRLTGFLCMFHILGFDCIVDEPKCTWLGPGIGGYISVMVIEA